MDLPYVDQSASGLRFYLIAGEVDIEPLTVIKTAECKWNHHTIKMGILGASHFLKIERDDGEPLYEVFACAELDLDRSFIKSAPFSQLPAQVQVSLLHMRYRFSPRLVCWEDGIAELADMRTRIATPTERIRGLEHQFPILAGDEITKPPLTLLLAKTGGQFTLKTAHCYPNENQIVFTTTTLSKLKG